MSDVASFAHGRHLGVTVKQAWAAATESWAMDTDCAKIDTEDTSEFFRVWLSCAMYGVCMVTAVSVPYYLCTNRRDKDFDSPEDRKIEFDLGETRPPRSMSQTGFCVEEEEEDPTPNLQKAKEHFRQTSPLTHEGKWRGVFGTSLSGLSEVGGIGVELYFRLLRSLGLCFSYLTIFSLPVLYFSWNGNFVPDIGNQAAKTTVGNIGRMAKYPWPQESRLVIVGCQGMELVKITKYFGWCDFFGILTFLLFVAWYRFNFIPKAAIRDDEENISPSDFAVEVDCLPEMIGEQGEYEKKLAMHILSVINTARGKDKHKQTKSEPKVAEVALVRNFDQRLGSLREQAALKKQQSIAAAYGKDAFIKKYGCCGKVSVQEIIEKNTEKLSQNLQPEPELPVLRAYVLLDSPDDKTRLLMTYRFANFRLGRCCQSNHMRFEGKAIRVRPAPEPSNILWVNQDVPWQKRVCLKWAMLFVWLVVMIISLLLVYATQWQAREAGTKAGTQLIGEPGGKGACDAGTKVEGYVCNASRAMEWTAQYVRSNLSKNATGTEDHVNCFCTTKGHTAILKTDELRNTADGICKDFLIEAGKTQGWGMAASIIVVAINVILLNLIMFFVDKEKHTSVSSLNSSVMVKVAVSQFLNTAAIIFLLNYNGLGVFNGDYSDFERGWYGVVGSAICLNMFLNSFTGAVVKVVTTLVVIVGRWPCFTRKMKHQAELLAAYENPEFNIASRYAQILTTCFCTLVYSPGLPILNFFAVIYFFLNYWVDKWILLQGSKRPPAYDCKMPKGATELLLFAAPLHLLFSIAMYSHPCTFPSKALGGSIGSMADQAQSSANAQVGEDTTSTFTERVSTEATWMHFVALILVLCFFALLILRMIVGATLGSMWSACKTICCPRRTRMVEDNPVGVDGEEITWDKAWHYIERTRPPASYRMENNREYQPLVRFLRNDFAEACSSPSKSGGGPSPLGIGAKYAPDDDDRGEAGLPDPTP